MTAADGASPRTALLQRLAADAPSFDFYQAVRMILRGAGGIDTRRRSGVVPPVRFRSNASFQFKASDVQSIRASTHEGESTLVTVNFLGVASPGIIGSLPNWYATLALDEARHREHPNAAVLDFFALFDDRLIQLFFRAWLHGNLPIQYELAKEGPIARVLTSIVGFGVPGLRRALPFDVRALVHHAALLLRRPVTALALADSLATWFGVPFEVLPFQEWTARLEPEQRMRLGDHTMRLGETTALGDSVTMRQAKFRLRAGPLRWAQFTEFLPGDAVDGGRDDDGPALRELVTWVRQAVGAEFEYDLQLVLEEADVPVLAFRSDEPQRARLGMSTWLGARSQGEDAEDTAVAVSALDQHRRRAQKGAAARRSGA
ncbi:MAG: type VI secretion system baseplate subunit TssG [Planctomycetes bacterium]|nr:type VI secretion system baseplate subunit TssG [Planctomycetota bacterium]